MSSTKVFPAYCALMFFSFALLLKPYALHAVEIKSITVAGFINTGEARDASVNIQMTKSLITFLSKFTKNVTPYADLEKAARPYWKMKYLDENQAIGLGQSFDTKQVLTGTYQVNNEDETIAINVSVYDVVTGDLKLKRTYKGSAGPDLFDTIDKMIHEVSGLIIGRTLDYGSIRVNALSDNGPYKLFIDGIYIVDLTNRKPYLYKTFAGSEVIVSVRMPVTGREAFQQAVVVPKNATVQVDYKPSGTILVKAEAKSEVYLEGKLYGYTASSGDLSLSGIPASKPVNIQIRNKGKIIAEETATLNEGDLQVFYAGIKDPESLRTFFFPVQIGMLGWLNTTYAQAGIDWRFIDNFNVFAKGGAIVFNQAPIGIGFVPIAEAGVGYMLPLNTTFKVGGSLSALFIFGTVFGVMPVANAELDIWKFFITAGVRFSLMDNSFYPVFSFGIKI